MTNYRILEKEGITTIKKIISYSGCKKGHKGVKYGLGCHCSDEYIECKEYIPRFIVQERYYQSENAPWYDISNKIPPEPEYKDLKEFTSLEEARQYKRSLELKEGIVRE